MNKKTRLEIKFSPSLKRRLVRRHQGKYRLFIKLIKQKLNCVVFINLITNS